MANESNNLGAQLHGQESAPDFENMNRAELSAWFVGACGYDLGVEDPDLSLSLYRTICFGIHKKNNEVIAYLSKSDYLAICVELNQRRATPPTSV